VPARPVEREHVLRADALAKRVLGDQRLELADHVPVMAEREVGLDPPLECDEAELLETRALVFRERLRELGKRGPAPERERLTQQLSDRPGIALRERLASVGGGALEPGEVELVVAHLEHVARSAGVQPWFGKRLAQVRDVDLHHLLSRVRDVLAPESVDDPLAGERAVRVQKQNREERPLLACRDLQRRVAIEHLQRAEQAKVHLERRSTLPLSPPGGGCESRRRCSALVVSLAPGKAPIPPSTPTETPKGLPSVGTAPGRRRRPDGGRALLRRR
jgi:hypothetical protein